jgi:hypothetical protein
MKREEWWRWRGCLGLGKWNRGKVVRFALYVVLVRTRKADGWSEIYALACTKEVQDPRLPTEF